MQSKIEASFNYSKIIDGKIYIPNGLFKSLHTAREDMTWVILL